MGLGRSYEIIVLLMHPLKVNMFEWAWICKKCFPPFVSEKSTTSNSLLNLSRSRGDCWICIASQVIESFMYHEICFYDYLKSLFPFVIDCNLIGRSPSSVGLWIFLVNMLFEQILIRCVNFLDPLRSNHIFYYVNNLNCILLEHAAYY